MGAGELLVRAIFGTVVPGDQGDERPGKVTSGRWDWMLRNLIEFPSFIQSIQGDYLNLPYRA